MKKCDLIKIAWASLGVAAVASTAVPMMHVWQYQNDVANAKPLVSVYDLATGPESVPTQIVVDLQDNASPATIADVEREIGAKLSFNSPESQADKLMVATLPAAQAANAITTLQNDSRVEAAEPEMVYSLPEKSADGSREMLAAAMIHAAQAQALAAKSEALSAVASTETEENIAPDAANTLLEVYSQDSDSGIRVLGTTVPPSMPQTATQEISIRVHNGNTSYAVDDHGDWMFPKVNPSALMSYDAMKPGSTRPNDPLYDSQWNFKMVGAEDAWKKTKGKGVVVAVIDTGVAAKTTSKGKQCKDFNTTSFVPGYDFVNKDKDAYDDHGHGTHVAGTIAESTNNNEGVAGLAYESTIMPLKVLAANGSGYSSDIADAIRFAADNGANVINMSLGSARPSSVIHKAVQYAVKKGVTIVCAAGNGFGEPVGYPAAFPECIAVSSVGPSGKIATYSSYGKEVALAAPGGDMMESGNASDGILQNTVMTGGDRAKGDDYYAFQGTSMASPHVAAVAALIESQGVHDPARVREILMKSATPNGEPNKYGAGILSAVGAVSMTSAMEGWKLRHFLLIGAGLLLLAIGPRRSFKTRAGMAAALALGFFGSDWAANGFGLNSAWNMLTFSAALPAAAYLASRKSIGGIKIAGAFALGTAVNLWAGMYNDLTPFTSYVFGDAAHSWTLVNMGAAFLIANLAGWRAIRLSGGATQETPKA